MITEVTILGAVEAAIYREDDRWRAIRLAPSGKGTIDCTHSLALLMSSRAEQRALPEPLRDIDELETHLRGWSRRYRALDLLIAGMDSQLTDGTRRTCIRAAEELLLWNPDTSHFVRARLLGCPPSEEADISGGLRLCQEISAYLVGSRMIERPEGDKVTAENATIEGLYGALQKVESKIPVVRRILDEVLFFDFGGESNPEAARRAIIDAGVVADVASALAGEPAKVHAKDPFLDEELKDYRFVLGQFMARIHDLMEKKSEKSLIEEKFSRDRGPLTKFSDPGPVLEAAKFGIPRSHSTPFEIKPLEAPVEIFDPAYPYVMGGANPSQFPRAHVFSREAA
uniref:Uncharacterized protein n=1 Tax=Candidatus Kentrum eta TaxID=2126337 RepID=A0A450UN53_9GAMM|nr:MAG: hypothetical protein BECKH772A_GA0070896_100649 [Candidatus Kentron sp. H]VFJ94723.1 MAG: hypothetical protein BECKH772B_GA0070898_100669 [Candidatus Kentron sp. H]VFK01337.1 MAG: hypothetical protein BECKH772C_GA0070978_100638 [Candidatus Kentron sp. H]